ncbi:ROK family protein [Leifsonia sp. NPDC058194]|uniref:ROK family protein n=1 Tax=Leifsonia sp. NPDC058194 TaxID=3346374 RepID=UPI0036DD2A11
MVVQGGQHMVVDVGGSHVTAAAVGTAAVGRAGSGGARLLSRVERLVDSHASSAAVLDAWASACVEAAAGAGIDPGGCDWGLAMPGPFDYERGVGHYAGVGKFERLAGVDIRSALSERLGAHPDRIRFVHDAGAYGIGEWRFGAPTRHARFVCVTLGTGVGSAFVDDGSLVFDRADVPPGGEVHRLPFDGRDLEETVSTRALLARYASSDPGLSVKDLAGLARAGDARAQHEFDTAMEALALAVGPWLREFEATALVVGGSISRSWDVLERGFRSGLDACAPELAATLVIAPSRLLADAPLYGAAHLLERSAVGRCVTAPALP